MLRDYIAEQGRELEDRILAVDQITSGMTEDGKRRYVLEVAFLHKRYHLREKREKLQGHLMDVYGNTFPEEERPPAFTDFFKITGIFPGAARLPLSESVAKELGLDCVGRNYSPSRANIEVLVASGFPLPGIISAFPPNSRREVYSELVAIGYDTVQKFKEAGVRLSKDMRDFLF